jgi:hypothetical protein
VCGVARKELKRLWAVMPEQFMLDNAETVSLSLESLFFTSENDLTSTRISSYSSNCTHSRWPGFRHTHRETNRETNYRVGTHRKWVKDTSITIESERKLKVNWLRCGRAAKVSLFRDCDCDCTPCLKCSFQIRFLWFLNQTDRPLCLKGIVALHLKKVAVCALMSEISPHKS